MEKRLDKLQKMVYNIDGTGMTIFFYQPKAVSKEEKLNCYSCTPESGFFY